MKSYLKYGIALCALFAFLFCVGSEMTLAQPTHTFAGNVTGVYIGAFSRGSITVKASNGTVMSFAVGHSTVYTPDRQPLVGEWVKVTYGLIRGENAAYQVVIGSAPAASPQPPPPPKSEGSLMVTGKVVGMHNNQLTLKDDKGQTLYFSTGRSTVFIPAREPSIDEKVKVTYYVQRGDNVATQVENLTAKK